MPKKAAKQEAKQSARSAAATGAATKQQFQAMRSAGVSSNVIQKIRNQNRSYSAPSETAPTQTRQQAIRNANSLGQAIKIAASNDGLIGGKEMKNLLSGFGDNILKIRSKVDDLNNRLGSQNGDIGYKANAWNKMNTGQYDSQDVARQRLYGGMLDRTLGTTGDFASPLDKGFQKLRKGWSAFDVLGAGTQFRNSRDLTAGPGGWGQYSSLYNTPTDPMTDAGGATAATGVTDSETDPAIESSQTLPETQTTPNSTVFGDGSEVNSYNTTIKKKKSSRQRAGASAQGYNSQKINPTWAMGIGINNGYNRMLQS